MKRLDRIMLCIMMGVCLCACGKPGGSDVRGDVLLVIDMQNAYTDDGPWTCPDIDRAADNITDLIDSGAFGQVIFTRFDAPRRPVGTWKEYNEVNRDVNEDEEMNRLIPRMEPYADQYPVYSKSAYSSMTIKEVNDAVLACIERGDSLVLTGVVSECCVLATALDAIDTGVHVVYISDACAGVNEESQNDVMNILRGLDYVHTAILSTEEYLDSAEQ